MKKLQAIIASTIITGLVIFGMLAIGADAMRTAHNTRANASNATAVLLTQ